MAKVTIKTVRLPVVAPPPEGAGTVFHSPTDDTVIVQGSGGEYIFACGNCGAPLAQNVHGNLLDGVYIVCKRCGSYNMTSIQPSR